MDKRIAREGSFVGDSLSLVLPVRNAQATLEATVTRVLEVVSELTSEFEVLIVDDASHDATPEIAAELSRRYPQLRVVRNASPAGEDGCIRVGLERATREFVLVHPPHGCQDSSLCDLWKNRGRANVRRTTRGRRAQTPALAV